MRPSRVRSGRDFGSVELEALGLVRPTYGGMELLDLPGLRRLGGLG